MRRHGDGSNVMDSADGRNTADRQSSCRRNKHHIGARSRCRQAGATESPETIVIEQCRRTKFEALFRSNVDSVIAVSTGSEEREAYGGVLTGKPLELTKQVLRVNVSSLAAKAAGQRP